MFSAAAAAAPAPAVVRLLVLGPKGDPEFQTIKAALDKESPAPERHVGLAVSSAWSAFPEGTAKRLASLLPERVALFARRHWPDEDVFVVSSDVARTVGTDAVVAALSGMARSNRSLRRAEWRRNHGVLFGAATENGYRRVNAPRDKPQSRGPTRKAVAADSQSFNFSVDSDECATFSRNSITFDQPCGYGPGRGINIAVINQITGEIEEIYDFDTWLDVALAAQYAVPFIDQILPERLVLIGVADANDLDQIPAAVAAFQQRFGSVCVAQVDYRDSWVAISQNMQLLAEQCNDYSSTGNYVDSFVQYTMQPTPSNDTSPPVGSFEINSGAATTNTNLVTLDFSGITDSGSGLTPGGKVRLSNDGTNWSPMLDFSPSQNWVLDRGDGGKTVYAQFRDRAGNWTNAQTATVTLQEDTPQRLGPDSGNYQFAQSCVIGISMLGLSYDGNIALSTDLGSDWFPYQTILPATDYFGWSRVVLNCNASGAVLAAGFTIDDTGNLVIATSASSDGGNTWSSPANTTSVALNTTADTYSAGACSSSPTNLVVFWNAQVAGVDQIFALSSQDGGLTWPTTPAQLSNNNASTYTDEFTLQVVCSGTTVVAAAEGSNGVNTYSSADGGKTFLSNGALAPDAYSFGLLADPNGNIVLLAVSPSEGAYSISATSSQDGGATWTFPVLVAQSLSFPDISVEPYYLQAVAPAPGLIYSVWSEAIADDGTEAVRLSASKDGGTTWSSPVSITTTQYWYSFMLAEEPYVEGLMLAGNALGDVEVIWLDDRQGLGYAVQRFGVSAAARGMHEDADIQGITDIYVATSANFGASWSISEPLEPSIMSGASYLDGLTLTPTGVGIATYGELTNYLDVRFLSGAPAVTLSTMSLSFGNENVGTTSAPQTLTLTNSGTATLAISSVTSSGDFTQTNNCTGSVAPGGSCAITVGFSPSAPGDRTGTITMADDAADGPQMVSLSGTGASSGVNLSVTNLSFNNQPVGTTSAASMVTLTNNGNANLTISTVTITGTNAGDFSKSADACSGATVTPNNSCTVNVTFTPSAPGSRTATLSFADNAYNSPQAVGLSGTGTSSGVNLSTTSLSFNNQAVGTTSAANGVTLTNNGSANLTISTDTITGTNAGDFAKSADTCSGATVAPNGTCSVNIEFAPSAPGNRTASLIFSDNAANSPQTVSLSGTGTSASVNLSTTSLSFNSRPVATTSTESAVTLINNGNANLNISTVTIAGTNAGDFVKAADTCSGTTVAPNGTCSVSITFAPSASGSRTATLNFPDNASNSPQTVTLSGTGTDFAIAVSPASGTATPNTAATYTLTVTPMSGFAGTVALACAGAPAGSACSISAASVTLNGSAVTATVKVSVSSSSLMVPNHWTTPAPPQPLLRFEGLLAFGLLSLIGLAMLSLARREGGGMAWRGAAILLGVTTTSLLAWVACGGGPHSPPTPPTPTASLSINTLTFNPQNVGTQSAAQTVTLTDSSSAALTVNQIGITGTNAGDFNQTTNCASSVAAEASCTISVTFTPAADGSRSGTLTITDNAGGSPQSVTLTGTGQTTGTLTFSGTSGRLSHNTTASVTVQ
jgi:hypothetical protein